jgi:hypothetical protein
MAEWRVVSNVRTKDAGFVPASFKLQIDLAASKLQIFYNACGAFILVFCSPKKRNQKKAPPSDIQPRWRGSNVEQNCRVRSE